MEPRSLAFIAAACEGRLSGGSADAMAVGVGTDSRTLRSAEVFVALAGDRFDGHDFLGTAVERGALAVVVGNGRGEAVRGRCALVEVDDPRRALGRLGVKYGAEFPAVRVAVGGSNGKTTTKDLVASVASQRFRTLASEGSYNNDIGVPLTLLRLGSADEAAVFEVGTNHPGELAPLVGMIGPRIGVLTSLGREHLEFFGDLEGVAREEGWLAELLPVDGVLVVNGDAPGIEAVLGRARARVVRVGWGEANDWRAVEAWVDDRGSRFRVRAPRADFSEDYRINLVGRHQVTNALLAAAVGAELGLEPELVRRGLEQCRPPSGRMQIARSGGICVVNDAYNANPDSMRAALEALRELPCQGRRIAVLGEMAELGRAAEAAHRDIGRLVAESGVSTLYAVGRMGAWLAEGARAAGLEEIERFEDVAGLAGRLRSRLHAGDVVLVKASRAARLERVTAALMSGPGG